jgi:hypothetical protein
MQPLDAGDVKGLGVVGSRTATGPVVTIDKQTPSYFFLIAGSLVYFLDRHKTSLCDVPVCLGYSADHFKWLLRTHCAQISCLVI